MSREIVRLSICRLHGHQTSLVWKNLLTTKSEPDLTVDLSNCVGMKEWCDIHFCYYVSSHKILNQYIQISTGATSNAVEPNIGGANNHEPESKNVNKKIIQRTQERLDSHRHQLKQTFWQRRDTSSSRSRQRAKKYK